MMCEPHVYCVHRIRMSLRKKCVQPNQNRAMPLLFSVELLPRMATELTLQQSKMLKDVFNLFDKDGDGGISPQELNDALEALGQHVTREELLQMVHEADADDNGVIDLTDFTALYASRVNNADENEDDLVETFKFYDLNNTGYITTSNLLYAMEKLGCQLTPEEADEMIREADLDGDGRLDYRDFRRIMMAPADAAAALGKGAEEEDVVKPKIPAPPAKTKDIKRSA